jgi:thiol-disulfide isomerase/thioredoxin
MKKIKIILILITIGYHLRSYGQHSALKELHIGDHLPDFNLSGFYDDTTRQIPMRELYKGNLLILDFWATWCGSCLTEFGEFDQLKKEFGSQIRIVTVGYESYEKIKSLFKRQHGLKSDSYTVLTHDNVLSRVLFPHKFLPHLVWIDSTGKIIAITQGSDLTSSNISNAISGNTISAREKKDNELGMSVIFQPFHAMDTSFVSRSILTKKAQGFPSFEGMQDYTKEEPTKFSRIFMGNEPIRDLYRFALFTDELSGQNYSRIILEVKDSLKYLDPRLIPETFKKSRYKSYSEWEDQNLYCYELKMKDRVADTLLRSYMIADLNRYLNLNGRFEKRYMDCYILKTIPPENRVDTILKEPNPEHAIKKHPKVLNNKALLAFLNERLDHGSIVVDQSIPTGMNVEVDLSMKLGLTAQEINNKLRVSGLMLIKGKSLLDVFVISEN